MKKRILGTILLIAMLITSISVGGYAFTDLPEGNIGEAITRMTNLGLLKGYEDGTFLPQNNITRAEFVAVMNRALGMDSFVSGNAQTAPFNDVLTTHWASGDIAYAVSRNMIAGYGDGTFGPEDEITYEQTFKIIFNAMGYDFLAATKGEYPSNYIALAVENSITRGLNINFSDKAKRGELCYILDRAMEVNLYEQKTISSEVKYEKTDKTLLSELLRMKNSDILEGIVTENYLTGLRGDTTLEKNQVMIDVKNQGEIIYLVGKTNADQMLGQKVEFQIDKDDNQAHGVITSITPIDNKFFEVTASDYVRTVADGSSFVIEYEKEDEKIYEVKTEDNPVVIKNGRAIANPTAADISLVNGTIKFIENSKNSKYDVVIIETTFSFRVEKISIGTNSIFFKDETLNGNNRVGLDPDKEDFYYTLKNTKGEDIKLLDVKEDDIVTVRSDSKGENIDIIVSNNVVEGKASSYSGEDESVIINDKEYLLAKNDRNQVMVTPNLTKSGTYFLDAFGEIVSFEENETLIENVGYIYKKSVKNLAGDDAITVKILRGGFPKKLTDKDDKVYYETGNKDFVVVKFADKVTVDGVRKSGSTLNAAIVEGTMINYGTNKEGLVTSVDTFSVDSNKKDAKFNPEIGTFSGEFYIDSKTVIASVPMIKQATDPQPEEEDYFITLKLDAGGEYNVVGYEVDPKTKIAKYVILTTPMKADVAGNITSESEIFIVSGLTEKLIDDNTYCVLTGVQDGEEKSLTVKNDAAVYTIARNLKKGDVIYVSTNSQDLVDNIEYVDSLMPKPEYFHKDKNNQDKERVFGKLMRVVRNELSKETNLEQSEFYINIGASEEADQNIVTVVIGAKDMPPVYKINSKTGKVTVLELDDLLSVVEAGYGNYNDATEIFICKKDTAYKGIVVVE